MLFGKLFTNPKMWVNGDADEITMGGVYTCKDVQNVPTGDGALLVFKTENTVKQVFVPVGEEGVVYTRVLGEEWASVTGTNAETEALIQSAIDKANQAQAKADTVDTRLNNIIVESGTSDAEVVAARTDSSGRTFTTLGVRLDTQFGEVKEDLSAVSDDFFSYTHEADELTIAYRQGTINKNTGKVTSSTTRIYMNYTRLLDGIKLIVPSNMLAMVFYYTQMTDTAWVGVDEEVPGGTYMIYPKTGSIIRVRYRYTDDSVIAPSDGNLITTIRYSTKIDAFNASPSMFSRIGICGASWDSGYIYPDGTNAIENAKFSWGANVARNHGISSAIYAKHGVTTTTYLTDADCLPKLLTDAPCGLYCLDFGGNDSKLGLDHLGTIDDINDDYTQNPYTFYGNYGKIIAHIKTIAPKAVLICAMYYDANYHDSTVKAYYDAVVSIAGHFGLPVFNWNDDVWYANTVRSSLVADHPSAPLLSGIALAFDRLFSVVAKKYYDVLKTYDGFDWE